MHEESILIDIGLALLAATALAYVARFLRQPLLLAYIGAGLLVGPSGCGLIQHDELIRELSSLGLAFLMFIVGLEIDLKTLVRAGRAVLAAGVFQVVACAVMAVGVAHLLGYAGLPGLYLGVASAFSSTMIVVKLLDDKSELDTVAGRLTLGILLVQDALAIVVLALQPNLSQPSLAPLALSLLAGLALVAGALATARFALPPLFRWAAKSPEIVLVSAISWCLVISYLATLAGFSEAMGALIAGVTLSALPYTLDVVAKISSLRDFFVTLFFVGLGLQLELGSPSVLLSASGLSAVVLVSRFLTIGPILPVLGYGARNGLLSSIALAQTGEFALIIVSIGLSLGHIGPEIVSIIALTLVITSTVSSYMMMFNHQLAAAGVAFLKRFARPAEGRAPEEGGDAREHAPRRDIVLVGFHRAASSLLHQLGADRDLLIVDFSPEVYERLSAIGVEVVYGDISHLDTLAHAGLETARVVVSTVSEDFLRGTDNLGLLRQIRRLNPRARVVLSAETVARAREMYEAGADYVVLPRDHTARAFAEVLDAIERGVLEELRARSVADLAGRDEILS